MNYGEWKSSFRFVHAIVCPSMSGLNSCEPGLRYPWTPYDFLWFIQIGQSTIRSKYDWKLREHINSKQSRISYLNTSKHGNRVSIKNKTDIPNNQVQKFENKCTWQNMSLVNLTCTWQCNHHLLAQHITLLYPIKFLFLAL